MFCRLNEQQIIKGRRTLCKFLNKGLISEPVERLWAIQDVAKLKQLLYRNERHLRQRYYYKPKTLLLRNALDFKNLFCTLEETSTVLVDPINKSRTNYHKSKRNSNDRTTETLRQYYLKRLSARVPVVANSDNKTNKFIETAARCYIEGFQWHITYLEVCATKSALLRQKYASYLQQKQQQFQRQKRNNNWNFDVKSDQMNKCERFFINTTTTHNQTGDDTISAQANDILVTKLNQLNLNPQNNNHLPTIVLTDCSEASSDTNSIIFNQNNLSENLQEFNELHIPAITCHVESRPPNN